MAIAISGQTLAYLSNAKTEANGQVGNTNITSPNQQAGQPSSADSITLTDRAIQLQKLGATIASLPNVDAARINDIKQAINNGHFQIDPQRVAQKMINFENARGGSTA